MCWREAAPWLVHLFELAQAFQGTTLMYWGYIGIMENEMETTIIYWGYIGGLFRAYIQHGCSILLTSWVIIRSARSNESSPGRWSG